MSACLALAAVVPVRVDGLRERYVVDGTFLGLRLLRACLVHRGLYFLELSPHIRLRSGLIERCLGVTTILHI